MTASLKSMEKKGVQEDPELTSDGHKSTTTYRIIPTERDLKTG